MEKTPLTKNLVCANCAAKIVMPIYRHGVYGECVRASDMPDWTFVTEYGWLCENCDESEPANENDAELSRLRAENARLVEALQLLHIGARQWAAITGGLDRYGDDVRQPNMSDTGESVRALDRLRDGLHKARAALEASDE